MVCCVSHNVLSHLVVVVGVDPGRVLGLPPEAVVVGEAGGLETGVITIIVVGDGWGGY